MSLTLSEQIEAGRARYQLPIISAIDLIIEVANQLAADAEAKSAAALREHFCGKTFRVLVVGRFKTGKSTLLNALLGRLSRPVPALQNRGGPMPVDDLPCTATLTKLHYADEPNVRVFYFDGQHEAWTFEDYVEKARLKDEETGKDNSKLFETVEEFEIGFPSQTLQAGVEFGDSPGHDEDPRRTEATMRALVQTDAAIIVFQSVAFAGESELRFQREAVQKNAKHLFTVVNMWEGRSPDRRFVTHVLERLGYDTTSDPREHDIFFIDARSAQRAVYSDDASIRTASGLEALEQRLSQFLFADAYRIFVEATLQKADVRAATLRETLEQRRAVLKAEAGRIRQVLDANERDLRDLDDRAHRFATKVKRAKAAAGREARASFERLLLRIESDLPNALERKLESLEGMGWFTGPFSSRAKEEVARLIQSFVDDALRAWSTNGPELPGLQYDVTPVIEDLADDLAHEAKQIESLLRDMRVRVSGLDPSFKTEAKVITLIERIASAGAGLILSGPGGLLAAGGGWNAVIGGAVATFGAGMAATLLGVALTGPVGIAIAVAAGTIGSAFGGAMGYEKRVKAKVLEDMRPSLRKLRDTGADEYKVSERIEAGIETLHDELKGALESIIQEERDRLDEMKRLSEADESSKTKLIRAFDAAEQKLDQAAHQLAETKTKIEQYA